MTTIAMLYNKVFLANGTTVLGQGRRGCCLELCFCRNYFVTWNGLDILLDPSAGYAQERTSDGCLRFFAAAEMVNAGCPGGGNCSFFAYAYFDGTVTTKEDDPNSPCIWVDDLVLDEVVAINVVCDCEDEIENATVYAQDTC